MKSLSLYGVVLLLFSVILSVWGAAPSVTCTPSRTSGVAPLAVFLDCSATTDADLVAYATQPFHDLLYQHSFGDTVSGKWGDKSTGSAGAKSESRNVGWGPLAAHVYETAGTYTITTLVRDGTNTVRSVANVITVTDPNTVFATTATVCFYNTTVGTGCPAGATQTATSAFDTALNSCIGTTKRCLFKKGDSFLAAAASVINSTGPGIIGAYGSGAAPHITGNAVFVPQITMAESNSGSAHDQNVFIQLSAGAQPTITDWRIMDLELDGQSVINTMAMASSGGIDQVTVLRVNCHHMATTCFSLNEGLLQSINGSGNTTPFHIWDQIAIVDSNLDNITGLGHINAYTSATQLMEMGNSFDTGTNEIVRWPYVIKGVFSHNYVANTSKNHLVKIHAPNMGVLLAIQIQQKTQYLVFSDNKFIGDNGAPTNPIAWPVAMGPFDNLTDERVYDVIYERNWTVGSSTTQVASIFWMSNLTFRNNVCDLTISANVACLKIDQRGVEPVPDNHYVYNNTLYSAKTETVNPMEFLTLGTAATNTHVENNIGYTPNAGALNSYMIFGGSPASNLNNSTDRTAGAGHQMKNTSPLFDNVSALTGFRIGTGSYAASGGSALFPSSNDDALHCDDNTANKHKGAFVPRARAQCRGVGQ